jgi:hypothetical protein
MYPSTFNLGHALPLIFIRFWCCARRRTHRREFRAVSGSDAAAGISHAAKRVCVIICDTRHSPSATHYCQRATRHTASCASYPLRRL